MRRSPLIFYLLPIAAALACLVRPACAQGPEPNRVLKSIDFEERRLGNNEDLPMHWVKVAGKGLPRYVNGVLATDKARSGQYSFRFDLNGGSLVYRYDPTQIAVTVGARYEIEVYCQTTLLPNARARLSAYFTDIDGHPLPETVRYSDLYAAQPDDQAWTRLSVEMDADNPKGVYLAIELGLLQPVLYAPASLGDRTLFPQDIRGSAWFDDVTVAQVPQVTLGTDRPGNVFRLGDVPRMSVVVNDLFTDDLQSKIMLTDATGAIVYQRTGAVDRAGSTKLGPTQQRLNIALPHLATGWYHADLQMSSHGRSLGEQSADLIQLADAAEPTAPDPRFGVIATDMTRRDMNQLPLILPILSAGRVKIAVWNEHRDIEETDSDEFDALLENLQAQGITPTGCLVGLPPALAAKVGGSSWEQLLRAPADDWQPQIAYLIARHANHLDRWQLGADGSDAFVGNAKMRQVYQLIYKQFGVLIHNPDLAMPWPAWYDLGKDLPATVALSVPAQVLPSEIPLYMNDVLHQPGGAKHNLSLTLQLLGDEYGRKMRLRDLAQRVVFALAGGADRIDFPLPFSVQTHGAQVVNDPQEVFLVERTLMRIFTGATYKGTIDLGEHVQTMLFDKNGQGILAMWTRGGADERETLSLNLGARPLLVDLWGNATPLVAQGAPRQTGQEVKVEVGSLPMFVVGIDGTSAQLRATIAFDEPLLESSFQPHARRLSFVNPSAGVLSGSLRLRPPPGWTISPSTFQFSVGPGQKFDEAVSIEFPYNSLAGDKTVSADFSLEGDEGGEFTVPLPLKLGLSDVGMQALALRDGTDLLVQETITNYGEKPIDYTAYAVYPGLTRQERLITALDAGRSSVKLFRFKGVKFIPGAKVHCGLRQFEGVRVLNYEVGIQ